MLEFNVITFPILYKKIKPGHEKPAPIQKNGFSTKIHDRISEDGDGSDLIYYGYRHYSPKLGRFISKDPIEEAGGINLYAMAGNDTVNGIDALGFKPTFTSTVKKGEITGFRHTSRPSGSATYKELDLYQFANSQLSKDILNHYYNGGGSSFCVTCHQELLNIYREKGGDEHGKVEEKHWDKLKKLGKDYKCNKSGTFIEEPKLPGWFTDSYNFILSHTAIGNGNFSATYECQVNIYCVCCPKDSKKSFVKYLARLQCKYHYEFWDWFQNAYNVMQGSASFGLFKDGDERIEAIDPSSKKKGQIFKIEGAWDVTNTEDIFYKESCN